MTHPVVSVIVPAYGLDKFLPQALDSLIAQTFGDWECIIVDDASPDTCGEIAETYVTKDKRFHVIHNAKNEYLAGSLNIGIAQSKGRYVIPLDADNWLAGKTVLETLVSQLDVDRSIDIAYGKVRFVMEDGAPDMAVGPGGYSQWPMPFRADWQLMGRNLIPSTSMYRRRVWELTGGYRRRWKTAEDADFWTRATSYGFGAKMVTEADVLVYRNRDDSMSRVNEPPEYSAWYPWSRGESPPGGALVEPQPPIPSCEPVLISVVIPVGPGHEELVIDALDSVDAQTLRLWEVIVVNDTGKPLRWLPSWARLTCGDAACPCQDGDVCHYQDYGKTKAMAYEPRGVAAARNKGISLARARLFVPLDADDTLEPQALELMFGVQKRWGGYVYGDWNEINAGQKSLWKTQEYDAQLLISKGCLHAVTGLFPVAAWKLVGGYDETLPAWEDWDFQLKLADAEVCGTRIPKPLFTYRKDTGMRRDANFASFEESKAGILAKWKDYFGGSKELAGCRSCGGGGNGRVSMSQPANGGVQQAGAASNEETVLVEYTGKKEGAVNFRGPSGTSYRFAANSTDRVKMVRRQDVEFFERLPDFAIRQTEAV